MTNLPHLGRADSLSKPYVAPAAFLPATSDIPVREDLPPSVHRELQRCHMTAGEILAQLERHIHSPAQIVAAVHALSQQLAALVQLTAPDQETETTEEVARIRMAARRAATADMSAVMAEACTIYDDYFGVVRVSPMTRRQFVAQVANTCFHLFCDLPYTLLDRAQIIMLLCATRQMLAMFTATAESTAESIAEGNGAINDDRLSSPPVSQNGYYDGMKRRTAYAEFWEQPEAAAADRAAQVAHYRWKVGHHLFNLCTIFCRHALQQAQRAVEDEVPSEGARQLYRAEQFLRGTTAAMWYAGEFPAAIYREIIRPSMVMPGAPAGFSGDQNADYNRMKDAKQLLKEQLRNRYTPEFSTMPRDLLQALLNFHEADVQDVEHHLLIAANKVGADHSLAQKEWMADLPASAHIPRAIDMLRDMAETRRQELMA